MIERPSTAVCLLLLFFCTPGGVYRIQRVACTGHYYFFPAKMADVLDIENQDEFEFDEDGDRKFLSQIPSES